MQESEILSRIQGGDGKAFKQLYDRYRPNVYQTSLRYLKSSHLAEEVVQEVFMKIWLEKARLDNVNSIKAWIYIMTKNNILNRLKKLALEWKANAHFANNSTADLSTVNNLHDKEYRQVLDEVVQSLPKQQREVFELARYQYLSYRDIGEKLDISPLTVKTHMSRAIKSIRLKMNGFGLELPLTLFLLHIFF